MLTVRGNRKASDVSEINAHLIKKIQTDCFKNTF